MRRNAWRGAMPCVIEGLAAAAICPAFCWNNVAKSSANIELEIRSSSTKLHL